MREIDPDYLQPVIENNHVSIYVITLLVNDERDRHMIKHNRRRHGSFSGRSWEAKT